MAEVGGAWKPPQPAAPEVSLFVQLLSEQDSSRYMMAKIFYNSK